MADPDVFTPQERFQAVMHFHGLFLIFQNSFYLTKEGTLDPEMRNSLTSVILGGKDQPGFKFYWEKRRDFFKKEFRDYVEDLIVN